MDIIKLLDNLEVGIPLIVVIKWLGVPTRRKVTLYAGTKGDGIYNFIDDTGVYGMTAGYIRERCHISRELDQDDLYELMLLCNKVKGVK